MAGPWQSAGCYVEAITHGKRFLVAKADGAALTKAGNEANTQAIASLPDLLSALELLYHGCEQAQKNGLNQPQVNGGMVLARSALIKAGYTF